MKRVDAVEEREHARPRGLVEPLDLGYKLAEGRDEIVKAAHMSSVRLDATTSDGRRNRLLVACVGNLLRGDDGFGPAVAERLVDLPAGVEVIETGIGGVAFLQELMRGCDGVIVVDATDRGAAPGTVFVLEPRVDDAEHVPDVHLANPERVLSMAKTMGCLPERVVIVGCQPAAVALGERLSAPVERAVDVAVEHVREILAQWLEARRAGTPAVE
jgi:hydrogenase maturation protease